jgi:hypothetical protein
MVPIMFTSQIFFWKKASELDLLCAQFIAWDWNCNESLCVVCFTGAEVVTTDQWTRRVTVTGDVRPEFALYRVQRVKPNSTFWSVRPWTCQIAFSQQLICSNKQGITNTLALPIDKMLLYIYALCSHSEHQQIPFQSKQSKHFHQKHRFN